VTRDAREDRTRTQDLSPEQLARRLFGFLARKAGISGRRWRDALPQLEKLARERGTTGAWEEVERIERFARMAVNPGGYAFACLFPDGRERPPSPLQRVLGQVDPGPLFRGLDEDRPGKPDAAAALARAGLRPPPRTSTRQNAP
jgi:hypothetical protein